MLAHTRMYEAKLLLTVCLTLWTQCANGVGEAELYRISHLRDLAEHSSGGAKYIRLNGLQNFAVHARSGSVYVSVNNSVLRLSLDALKTLNEVTWASPEEHSAECTGFGVKSPSCEPYTVTLLVPVEDVPRPDGSNVIRTGLYICLSNNIFSECSLRRAADLRVPPELHWKGNDRCPADANKFTVATVATNGHLYMGTEVIAPDGAKAISILRVAADTNHARWPDAMHISRTEPKDDWIVQNERTSFVRSFEYNNAVYFIFKEVAQEVSETCGKEVMVARVGRICLLDDGGKDGFLRSFTKATLVCPSQQRDESGATTFVHSDPQSVHVDQSTKMLYVLFTTPSFAPRSSAICAYRLTDVERVFEGPLYSALEKPIKVKNGGNCALPTNSEPLGLHTMYDTSRPRADLPLMTKGVRWLHLVVSWAPFTLKRDNNLILFTVDENGILQKWHHFKSMTCLVEEIHLQSSFLTEGPADNEVLKMELLESHELDKAALFIATRTHLYRLPVARCGRLGHSQEACELMHDPYCGWNRQSNTCELLREGHTDVLKFEACPAEVTKSLSISIDGAWGAWSPWSACALTKNDFPNSRWKENMDSSGSPTRHKFGISGCQCRYRYCSFPYSFGPSGKHCDEASAIQLANCSVDGGWTEWTPWSGCEPTCILKGSARVLPAQRIRQRWCTNPAPMGPDGKDCLGKRKEVVQCPSPDVTCPTEPPVLPSWSAWSAWSQCSSACNGGRKIRWRLCGRHKEPGDPPSLDITANYAPHIYRYTDCLGEAYEEMPCNSHPCPLTKVISAWSDWYLTNEDPQLWTTERRFRAECLATVPEVDKLQASIDLQQGHCKQRWDGALDCSPVGEFILVM
ncbi:unnamed protein product [Dicrocoelium dendriticum]|nr:unnamed protein product [Dicrocoelium dendriticum]